MEFKKEEYGKINDYDIFEYTLTNSNDFSVSVINYGGIITKVQMPDKDGHIQNISVNVKSLEEILKSRPFHGAIVGPVAGRISKAEYLENDTKIKLTANENKNNLHSGEYGLDTKIWEVDFTKKNENLSLILKTKLFDGEDGFPGDRNITVTYTVTEENELKINYQAKTSKTTIFSPTNHVYFNLNGELSDSIYNHELLIDADYFAVLDSENLPTGELRSVNNSIFDLRKRTSLRKIVKNDNQQIKNRDGIDHPFLLNNDKETPDAVLLNYTSGRKIEMFTNCDAVVVYTHNHEHIPSCTHEESIPRHSGVALETSSLPDAVNHEQFGSMWLHPDEEFNSTTTYKFSLIN